jgi:hypothetical protein
MSAGTLAGKMATVVDLVTRLPVHIWFEENPSASDTRFEVDLLTALGGSLKIKYRDPHHTSVMTQYTIA